MTSGASSASTLEALDHLEADTLILVLSGNEGPLQGVAGLVDWRLAGRLSRFVASGRLTGGRDEQLLMPGLGRLPVQRILVMGGGPGPFDGAAVRAVGKSAGRALAAARIPSAACALPGRLGPGLRAGEAARLLREGIRSHYAGPLTVLDATAEAAAPGTDLASR